MDWCSSDPFHVELAGDDSVVLIAGMPSGLDSLLGIFGRPKQFFTLTEAPSSE